MRAATLLALLPFAVAAPSASVARSAPAPVVVPRGGKQIDGKYIIRMKPSSISTAVNSAIDSIKSAADYTYDIGFQGFAASLESSELELLRLNPYVDYIEQDAEVTIQETQTDADWDLARLSSKEPGASGYSYDESAGEGTCAFVLDTGIDVNHPEFEGRATWLENFTSDPNEDGHGHGTHCAGTIGSKTYGVAKKTSLFAVKVLDNQGSGTNSGIIKGMEYIAKEAPGKDGCDKGSVVNMSLGGSFSQAVNDAAAGIADAGLFLAVAAGNDGANAATSSPASEPKACTVGASDQQDKIASFSNFGNLVDVFAPGVDILSTVPDGQTEKMDGTSMASPHVAGIGAYFLGLGQKVDGLCDYIADKSIHVVTGAPNGTTTGLINNGYSA
ncbi:cerevisin [Geosmithia morbida]|uniref:Cerevisin n=1 Tax=Geosmithia morbida TaxID=1094350 RepID=A0A9P4YUJ7_9HYPO|nr:cerevisin [Geosmithia morbida]KAF4122320.1 cerevisin [Geosmithia morbida]